ncbi:hypothetical protein D9757_010866 [Collybiopsis confluens]|uniref:Uncharacterized protein n=1 Tax=Collybiopsis confluens TaxID=2823264 RepID=A0A8H5H8I4_9AGAR|nr:hypothetical protein D9757_010866 [Collybiopsis confluens]
MVRSIPPTPVQLSLCLSHHVLLDANLSIGPSSNEMDFEGHAKRRKIGVITLNGALHNADTQGAEEVVKEERAIPKLVVPPLLSLIPLVPPPAVATPTTTAAAAPPIPYGKRTANIFRLPTAGTSSPPAKQ